MEELPGDKLNLSKSTLRNIDTKGVGVRSTEKIISFIQSLPKTEKKLIPHKIGFGILRRLAVRSNSVQWLPLLEVCETIDGVPTGMTKPAINFLHARCDHDYKTLCSARIKIKTDQIGIENQQSLWEIQENLWTDYSLVPIDQLQIIRPNNSHLDNERISQASLYLEYDFYLQLVASIEVGILLQTKALANQLNVSFDTHGYRSFIYQGLKIYAQSTDTSPPITSCFGGLLSVLKDDLYEHDSKKTTNSDWRKLARFIEINEPSPNNSSESLQDRQYKQLKRWRSGQDIPSKDTFERFTEQYLEYIQKRNDQRLSFCFLIMVMLDNLEIEILDRNKREHPDLDPVSLKKQIRKVLSGYPRYYDTCLERELQRAEE